MAKTTSTVVGPRKQSGTYTAMMFTALVALATGCGLLFADWDDYGRASPPDKFQFKTLSPLKGGAAADTKPADAKPADTKPGEQ